MKRFLVDLNLTDDEIEENFRSHLFKLRLSDPVVHSFVKKFGDDIIPRLAGMRDLLERGSNIEFRRTLNVEAYHLVVELNTSSHTLIERLRKLLGG